ncbi:MAG TPA: hypothetical protein VGA56_07140, partial [Opitutaceae bacterium]
MFRLAGVEEIAAAPSAAAAPAETIRSILIARPDSSQPRSAEADDLRPPREARHPTPPPAAEVVQKPSEPEVPNERAEIERFANDADDRIDAVQRDYYLEMEELGWNSILQPWHLDQDAKLLASKAMVREAGSVVRKYAARAYTVARELRAEIYRLAISDRSKKVLEAIVERYVIDARWDELWALEKRKIAKVGDVINLLAGSKRGVAWKIEDNRLLFANPSSVRTKFNALMAELERIAEKKLRIHREVNAVRTKRLMELK